MKANIQQGWSVRYREGEVNHCPGCGRSHWYIGRTMAECLFCTTAIPLPEITRGNGVFVCRGKGGSTTIETTRGA